MTKALRQRKTGMCSYAMNACCFPLSSRRVALRLLRWAGLGALRPANQRAAAPPLFLSLSLSLSLSHSLNRWSLAEEQEARRMRMVRMDAIPCRLVFLALFFGARIQHTDGTSSSLSLSLCVCVCVLARALVWGQRRAALCLKATAVQRVFLLRWRRSETDREMLSAQASLFRRDREERRRKSFKAPHLIALGTVCVCVLCVCVCVWSIHV